MRALKIFLKVIVVLAIALVGALFSEANKQQVSVDFFLGPTLSISLGFWLLLFLFVGVLMGILASSALIFSSRRQLRRLKRQKSSRTPASGLQPAAKRA